MAKFYRVKVETLKQYVILNGIMDSLLLLTYFDMELYNEIEIVQCEFRKSARNMIQNLREGFYFYVSEDSVQAINKLLDKNPYNAPHNGALEKLQEQEAEFARAIEGASLEEIGKLLLNGADEIVIKSSMLFIRYIQSCPLVEE